MQLYLLVILASSGSFIKLNAQSPIVDGNWIQNVAFSDEFNGTSVDLNKWLVLQKYNYPWGDRYCFNPGPNNVIENGDGFLKLIATSKPPIDSSCYFTDVLWYSGGIQTKSTNYLYGYFEISAKLPGFFKDGTPCGSGFWPAFWTYFKNPPGGDCVYTHDEIDILEPNGSQYADGMTNVVGWHDEPTTICSSDPNKKSNPEKFNEKYMTSQTPLFEAEHKYAVEWLTDRMIFYFDDVPFNYVFDNPKLVMLTQYVVLNLAIGGNPSPHLDPATPIPSGSTMAINYFRYYQLNRQCTLDVSINNSTDLDNFYQNPAVKRSIIFGNGTAAINLNPLYKNTFRASNEMILTGNFTVPLGCEFSLIPTPCN